MGTFDLEHAKVILELFGELFSKCGQLVHLSENHALTSFGILFSILFLQVISTGNTRRVPGPLVLFLIFRSALCYCTGELLL